MIADSPPPRLTGNFFDCHVIDGVVYWTDAWTRALPPRTFRWGVRPDLEAAAGLHYHPSSGEQGSSE